MALLAKQKGTTARLILGVPQVARANVFVAGAVAAFGLACASASFAAAPA